MKPHNYRRKSAVALLASVVAMTTIAAATASAASSRPPNGVYTCAWIAAHPAEAAQARVTCDPSVFSTAMSSPLDTIDSNGCWDVPDYPNRISPGVYAWSAWEYSNQWSWYPHWGPPVDYTYYIQKPGPTTVLYQRFTDTGAHSIGLGAYNTYRWGAQNHTYPSQSWYVCHYTV
jgi:hypothetical protein